MANITISDGLLILATVAGPILAVQAQKWVERATEKRRQRLLIFTTLMTTRATRLATEHVQALNMIDLVFDSKNTKDRAVVDAWRQYADLLNQPVAEEVSALTAWSAKREDLFVDLLYALSQSLGYNFDKVELRRGIYYPKGHFEMENVLRGIQHGLANLLSGNSALPMKIVEFPVDEAALETQKKLHKRLLDALMEKASLTIKVKDPKQGG